jgi:DNA-binding CsgD family transcriptional regulator
MLDEPSMTRLYETELLSLLEALCAQGRDQEWLTQALGALKRVCSSRELEPPSSAEDTALHAESAAQIERARERIRAAAAVHLVRTRFGRSRRIRALEQAQPFSRARWTLVDSFEENGRRFIIARENRAGSPGIHSLTERERQVVVHAARGLTNKEIAYTLGVSANTVRVLMARASARLGARSRKELLARLAPPDLQPSIERNQ